MCVFFAMDLSVAKAVEIRVEGIEVFAVQILLYRP